MELRWHLQLNFTAIFSVLFVLPIQKACPGISQSILGSPIFQYSCIMFKMNPSLDKQFFKNKWAKSIFHLKTIYIYINPRKQTMRKGLTFEIPI